MLLLLLLMLLLLLLLLLFLLLLVMLMFQLRMRLLLEILFHLLLLFQLHCLHRRHHLRPPGGLSAGLGRAALRRRRRGEIGCHFVLAFFQRMYTVSKFLAHSTFLCYHFFLQPAFCRGWLCSSFYSQRRGFQFSFATGSSCSLQPNKVRSNVSRLGFTPNFLKSPFCPFAMKVH